MNTQHRRLELFGVLVACLAAIASASGIFLRGDLATSPFVTARGDRVDLLIGGIYRLNGKSLAAEGVGWDVVTLFVIVPILALLLPRLAGGSLRASLAVVGVFAYLLYQYAEYATALAYGPLFPLHVAIFALSLSGIALVVASIDVASIPARIGASYPHRGVIGFGLFMAVLLGGMWLPLVARTAVSVSVPELAGGTTLVVQAFDLGFLVPLGLFTAATVHRRLAVGYVLAAVVTVKGVAMGCAIAAMLLFEGSATGTWQAPPILLFGGVATVATMLASRTFGAIGAVPAQTRGRDDQPAAASPKSVSLTTLPERS